MTDVQVPYGDNPSETAVLLLAAAEEAGEDQATAVRTGSFGTFFTSEEIAKAAGVDYVKDDGVDVPELLEVEATLDPSEPDRSPLPAEADETPAPEPARKTTARKTAAKKTTASKE